MAKAVIKNKQNGFAKISEKQKYFIVNDIIHESVIKNKSNGDSEIVSKNKEISINDISYGAAKVSEILPFRIRFTNIGIRSYSANNPAPIGIAVIGLNNYIL